MNINRIVFSAVVTCLIGAVLGIAAAEINRADYRPRAPYQNAAIGAIMGLVVGAGQETIRQMAQMSEEIDSSTLDSSRELEGTRFSLSKRSR